MNSLPYKSIIFVILIFYSSTLLFAQEKEKRSALVIGNSKYQQKHISSLKNPSNDAKDIAKLLDTLQFNVILLLDGQRTQMIKAFRLFGETLKKGGVGLFYYAGHGVQIDGQNYLLPVNTNVKEKHEIELESVNIKRILGFMGSAKNRLNLVILDACRNNPFSRGFRSISGGLAQMDAPLGTLIAYATAPGNVASDGSGRNGVYTKHLLKQLSQPNIEVSQMFKYVRRGVRQETKNRQIPWESTSLEGDFYFVPSVIIPVETELTNNKILTQSSSPVTPLKPKSKNSDHPEDNFSLSKKNELSPITTSTKPAIAFDDSKDSTQKQPSSQPKISKTESTSISFKVVRVNPYAAIYSKPGVTRVGQIPKGEKVKVIEKIRTIDGKVWNKIEYKGMKYYIKNSNLN